MAVYRAALTGGGRLIGDLYMQHLSGSASQAANRAEFLQDTPYEQLVIPVAVRSGLRHRGFFDTVDVARLAARLPDGQRVDLPRCRPSDLD